MPTRTLYPLVLSLLLLCVGTDAAAQEKIPARPARPGQHMMPPTDARSTVRHVLLYQQMYLRSHGRFATSIDSLGMAVPDSVRLTHDATPDGFAAVATDGGRECAAYVGRARPPRPYAEKANAVFCVPLPPRP